MDFLTVFIRPPGDLIYFIVMIGSLMLCALMAGEQLVRHGGRVPRRMLTALGIALGAWLVGLLPAVASNVLDAFTAFSLERGVHLLALIALGWGFLTVGEARSGRFWTALAVVLGVLTMGWVVGGLTLAQGRGEWVTVGLVAPIVLTGGLVLTLLASVRSVVDVPLKLVWASLLAVGYVVSFAMLMGDSAAVQGAARLGSATSMVVVCLVVYRAMMSNVSAIYAAQVASAKSAAVSAPAKPPTPLVSPTPAPRMPGARVVQPADRDSVQLLKALGLMIEDTSPKQIPQQIVKAVLEVMRADVGALIRVQDVNYADIVVAYDRTRTRVLPGVSINLEAQPTLRNALERGQQRPLLVDRNEAELQDLYSRLGIETMGPAYVQPLSYQGAVNALLLIAYPFVNREIGEGEVESLRGAGVIAGGLLALSDEAEESRLLAEERAIQAMVKGVPLSQVSDEGVKQARQSAFGELQTARAQIGQLQGQLKTLEERLTVERNRLAEMLLDDDEVDLSLSQRIVAVNQEQGTLRRERDQLQEKLQQMESMLMAVSQSQDEKALVAALQALKHERDELEAQRDRLQAQIAAVGRGGGLLETAQGAVSEMGEERRILETERDSLRERLARLESDLKAAGVGADAMGVQQVIAHLVQERSRLQAQVTEFDAEREAWSRKVAGLNQRLSALNGSEARLAELGREVQNLAVDRDAAKGQLVQLRKQRDELAARVQKFTEYRERTTATIEALQKELAGMRVDAPAPTPSGGGRSNPLARELSRSMGRISELERELRSLRAKSGEPREVGAAAIDAMIDLAQELRSPLTSITGYLDLLLKESIGILGDMQRRFVQRTIANAQRLAGMVDDMVRLAALDAGRVTLTLEATRVETVVEAVISELSVGLREKSIEVDLTVEEDVPPARADWEAVRQMVGQLLTNAYLASPPSSVIRVMVGQTADEVIVRVHDSGVGIPSGEEETPFKRRYQTENPLLPGLGDTGVALAVARGLAELQGGRVWLALGEGGGTLATISLPRAEA